MPLNWVMSRDERGRSIRHAVSEATGETFVDVLTWDPVSRRNFWITELPGELAGSWAGSASAAPKPDYLRKRKVTYNSLTEEVYTEYLDDDTEGNNEEVTPSPTPSALLPDWRIATRTPDYSNGVGQRPSSDTFSGWYASDCDCENCLHAYRRNMAVIEVGIVQPTRRTR